jgi:predicted TIM-barrel fold metal-dependent hydrolase
VHAGPWFDGIKPYLSERSRALLETVSWSGSRLFGPSGNNYGFGGGAREDAVTEEGETELDLLRRQLLDLYDIDYGIITTFSMYDRGDPELAADAARAANDAYVAEYLEPEPRLLCSIAVPWEYPELAVKEIERRAGDPRWVQVMMPQEPLESLGHRRYWPIYEAAAAHGLPLARHVGWGRDVFHGSGHASFTFERHLTLALDTRGQLLSIFCSGVFEAVPETRIVMIEGGTFWGASLRWSLDSAFELLGDEVGLSRKPSEYMDESVWFSTQPIEEPDDPADFERMIEVGHLRDRILYASDWPHWDMDSPTLVYPPTLDKELKRKLMAGNACALYGLS